MKNTIAIAALSVILAACGGGGGGDTPSAPSAPSVPAISGDVTASRAMYFGGAATARTERALAVGDASPCSAPYASLFAGKSRNVDTDGNGRPDINLTDSANVVAFSVDIENNGQAGLNIDSDGDGTLDRLVDANCDGGPDYSIVSADVVSVIGAQVQFKSVGTGEITQAASGSNGRFSATLRTGVYDIETRSRGADGATIWGFAKGRSIEAGGSVGAVPLHRHPVLRELWIDGAQVAGDMASTSYAATAARTVAAGDVVEVRAVADDPNGRPLAASAQGRTFDGLTLRHTVTADEASRATLQLVFDINNNDAFTGHDASRDIVVSVTFPVAGGGALPELAGITVNGVAHANPAPTAAMLVAAAPVADGAPISIAAQASAQVYLSWYDTTVRDPLGTLERQQVSASSATLPGTVTAGVYDVVVNVGLEGGPASTVTAPVQTADRPAAVTGLLVNGDAPAGRVFRVGDTLLLAAQASDPLGRAIEYRFQVLGAATADTGWQPSSELTYTLTAADVTSSFRVRVFVRNDDGRTINASTAFDAVGTFGLTTSE